VFSCGRPRDQLQ
jgi:hypothetical protein